VGLTGEQRRAVGAKGSVVVVAGAGTGKTHMLTERYLHHLSEDGRSPLEVVAVTFTEKAAEELRSRVRVRARGLPTTREDLLAELETVQISTIHALCVRVCREHPEEAGCLRTSGSSTSCADDSGRQTAWLTPWTASLRNTTGLSLIP
jgi:ATP-dependent helicase/nuclease subunit A